MDKQVPGCNRTGIAATVFISSAIIVLTFYFAESPLATLNDSVDHFGNFNRSVYETVKDWTAFEGCQRKRLKRLKERCYNSGYRQYRPFNTSSEKELRRIIEKVIVDRKHNILLQTIPKTGCSSWKALFLRSVKPWGKLPLGINNWTMLAKYGLPRLDVVQSVAEIREYLDSYFFLLTVRHPFTRLESAFRNKFGKFNNEFMRRYGFDIIKRYRERSNSSEAKNVAYRLVVKFLEVDQGKRKDKSTLPRSFPRRISVPDLYNIWNISGPTFEEFIRYVIDRDIRDMNRHWETYEEASYPCSFAISYVGKTETADLDMEYISMKKLLVPHLKLHRNQQPLSEKSYKQQLSDLPLFEELPNKEEIVARVKKRYGTDMKLFGYTLHIDKRSGLFKTGCEEYGPDGICC